jgi:hypothetical protein
MLATRLSAVAQELGDIVNESDPNLLMPYLYCTLALYAAHSMGGTQGNLLRTLRGTPA